MLKFCLVRLLKYTDVFHDQELAGASIHKLVASTPGTCDTRLIRTGYLTFNALSLGRLISAIPSLSIPIGWLRKYCICLMTTTVPITSNCAITNWKTTSPLRNDKPPPVFIVALFLKAMAGLKPERIIAGY